MGYFACKFASNMTKQNKPLLQQNDTDSNKSRESQNLKDSDINLLEDIMKLF